MLSGLKPETEYWIAVRALASCDAASPIAVAHVVTGRQQFTTLHGCFIATAAFGTPLARELDALRHLRDRYLLADPLGQTATAIYYVFAPAIARAVASDETLRAGVRALIEPIARLANAIH